MKTPIPTTHPFWADDKNHSTGLGKIFRFVISFKKALGVAGCFLVAIALAIFRISTSRGSLRKTRLHPEPPLQSGRDGWLASLGNCFRSGISFKKAFAVAVCLHAAVALAIFGISNLRGALRKIQLNSEPPAVALQPGRNDWPGADSKPVVLANSPVGYANAEPVKNPSSVSSSIDRSTDEERQEKYTDEEYTKKLSRMTTHEKIKEIERLLAEWDEKNGLPQAPAATPAPVRVAPSVPWNEHVDSCLSAMGETAETLGKLFGSLVDQATPLASDIGVGVLEQAKKTTTIALTNLQGHVGAQANEFTSAVRSSHEKKYAEKNAKRSSDSVALDNRKVAQAEKPTKPRKQAPAPKVPGKKPVPTTKIRQYTLAAGDNLYMVSRKLGVSFHDLAKANGISDPSKLRVGQTLKVPAIASL